jgi:hypothetical protein
LSIDAWVLALAREKVQADNSQAARMAAQAAVARILEIQKRVNPDAGSMSIRDYIDHRRA